MNALKISNLRKHYANGFEALKGINLSIEQGDFFALLGPNGAGKSTLIGIVSSLINKSAGDVSVFDLSLDTQSSEVKRHIGVVPQEFNFSMFEPLIEIIVNQAGYYGIGKGEAHKRAESVLKQLDLWEKRRTVPRELSGGMKRRLMIARALVNQPKLLILDEPTAGVDIENRRSMWQFLKAINEAGTTIILTTHYLEEAERLCKRLAVIDDGEILKQGKVSDLLNSARQQTYEFTISTDLTEVASTLGEQLTVVAANDEIVEIEVADNASLKDIFDIFSQHGIEIRSMRNKVNRLEEFFLDLVKK